MTKRKKEQTLRAAIINIRMMLECPARDVESLRTLLQMAIRYADDALEETRDLTESERCENLFLEYLAEHQRRVETPYYGIDEV